MKKQTARNQVRRRALASAIDMIALDASVRIEFTVMQM